MVTSSVDNLALLRTRTALTIGAMDIRYTNANGLRFAYLEEGKGPLVLMLHGFPDTPQTWDAARPALAAKGFRVVTPFMRGYAPTEVPKAEAFDGETLGHDAVALIDALGEKQAILVGHDWGAGAAYSAAGLAPEKLRFLVTVGIPHPASMTMPTPSLLWAARHFFVLNRRSAIPKVRANDFAMIDHLVQRWSPKWSVPAGETEAVKRSFREPGSLEAALGYYRALRPWIAPSLKRRVKVDAAVFAGLDDTISPELYDRARSRYTAKYEVVRMPGGHFMHREHPEHFVRELVRLVAPLAS
jgi:pimeloyl-ACP methyl ester carboxylesterase